MEPSHPLPLPRLFNKQRFNLISLLGKGGMGEVYLARDLVLDKEVAVKVLHSEISEAQILRFRQEAVAVARLKHANILEVYDFAQADEGNFYLTMEVVRGKSLDELTKERAALSLAEFFEVADQLLAGLEHAHKAGVLHRDIKPSNVMLSDSEPVQVRLVDFGLAKNLSDEELSLTRTGLILGSPYYMSPEQIRGADTDARSDIYSFGCLAYKVLTGAVPFAGKDALETMDSHLKKIPRSLLELDPDLPPEIDELIQKCLAKDPELRFQDVSSLRTALAGVKEAVTPDDALDEPENEAVADSISTRRIHPALLMVPALIGVIVLFGAWNALFNKAEKPTPTQRKVFTEGYVSELKDAIEPDVKPQDLKDLLGADKSLRLDSRELSEEVLATLPSLKGLVILSAENSNLNDEAMKYIGDCKEIQELKINYNPGISPTGLSEVAKLPYLGKLEVANMNLEDAHLDAIAKAKQLFNLDISLNHGIKSGALKRLLPLKNLRDFHLGNRQIPMDEIVSFCNENKELSSLGLRCFPSPDPGLEKVSGLKYVRSFDLSRNMQVTGASLEALLKAPKVVALNLSSTKIPTSELLVLNKYPAIRVLNLNKRGMNSSDVDILLKLKYLERLQIRDNPLITRQDLARVEKMPGMKLQEKDR
ncbi:MAG: serine/threonine-protein kinase [Cyanobacteriota/Melainabacteria group bacterium]